MSEIGGTVNSAEAVEAMGMLPALLRRWSGSIVGSVDGMAELQRSLRFWMGISQTLDEIMGMGPLVLLVCLHLANVNIGDGNIGIAALFLMSHITMPFARMSDKLEETEATFDAWARLQSLAKLQRERSHAQTLFVATEGRLIVDNLTVQLPGMSQPIIRNLSFRLEPGRVLSLSGPAGCGKSTLLRAIIGIQQPSAGGCYLDGNPTWQWDRLDFARHVGYLPQDVGLANGTVADCIARLGPPDLDLVLAAARRAGVHNLIASLPNGYSSRLTEYTLSTGQRQRVALARAIYGRPQLVVLDEPASWLDEDGREMLKALIEELRRDRTSVIFTSHEPGLLEKADHGILLGAVGTAPRDNSRRQIALPVAQ
jgi:ATP-binding cassette subfamily C protein